MSKIYTQIGAGGHKTQYREQQARDGLNDTDLGKVRAGELVQINMGWGNDAEIFRRTAEEILEHFPDHPYRDTFQTKTVLGHEITVPGFPIVAHRSIERLDPDDIAGVFVDYEAFQTQGKHRFELGFRPSTDAEILLMSMCYATARAKAYQYTGRGISCSCWNTPAKPLDERNDWDSIVNTHKAMGSQYVIVNGYQTNKDEPAMNAVYIREAVEKYRSEFKKRGYPVQVVVAISLSTHPSRYEEIDPAALIYKAQGARKADADVLLWLNADWYTPQNESSIKQRFHILGGVFNEPDRRDADRSDTD